jgi:hypothetical protein
MSDTTKTANRLIKQHGEDAPHVAADRAAESARSGDEDDWQHWAKVIVEAKVLLARDYSI